MSFRALLSGVSGLKSFTTGLDVIGNNIANVDTTAYKNSTVTYKEVLTQTMKEATSKTNPRQVGLGVKVGAIEVNHNQGILKATGRLTDMAIEGDGFFVVQNIDGGNLYTRDGSFVLDSGHNLVTSTGLNILGWQADSTGAIDTGGPLVPINIPIGEASFAVATTSLTMGGNLDSNTIPAPLGGPPIRAQDFTTTSQVYDSLGNAHTLTINFYKISENVGPPPYTEWTFGTEIDGIVALPLPDDTGANTVRFDEEGQFDAANSVIPNISFTAAQLNNGAADITIVPDFSATTQLNGSYTMAVTLQDGYALGTANGFSINSEGVITISATNGYFREIGQIAMSIFNNAPGLSRIGNNLYKESVGSGNAQIGEPLVGGRGSITANYLEGSNVDLSEEFTRMIVTQRAFQANSKVITTASELLAETNNLIR